MDLVKENGSQTLADYDYDTASRRRRLTRANGDATTYAFEADSDLATIAHTGLPSSPTFTFGRNAAHQITSTTISDATLEWLPGANATTAYVPNSLNQYASVGGVTYGYDAKGNLTSDGALTFTYDAENRLLTALVSGTTTTYAYDGLGRRIKKTVGSTVTEYLLDGDEEIAEYDGSGTLLRRYVYGPAIDDRVLMYEGTGTANANERFYYANHQGSTMRTADGGGSVTETFVYSPYGESSTVTGNPYRFTGRRFDAETGLYYYRARYYSPKLGRFLQTDPIGYEDDANLYAYVGNDPLNGSDPTGREAACVSVGRDCFGRDASDAAIESFTELIVDNTPVIGDIKGAIETAQDPSVGGVVAGVVGIAAGGDLLRGPIKRIFRNADEGRVRQNRMSEQLAAENPNASIQNEQYLRDADGNIVKDPVTGEGRRVDHAVIEDGRARTYETTSMTADKNAQIAKETRVREAGGEYVRDRRTGNLCTVEGVSELRRCP